MTIELQDKWFTGDPDVTYVQLFCPDCEGAESIYAFWCGEHDGTMLYRKPYMFPAYPRCLFGASLLSTESDEDVWRPKDELACDWCDAPLVEWDELDALEAARRLGEE